MPKHRARPRSGGGDVIGDALEVMGARGLGWVDVCCLVQGTCL